MATKKLSTFERDLLESVRQAEHGEAAATHTPDEIVAKRMRDDSPVCENPRLAVPLA